MPAGTAGGGNMSALAGVTCALAMFGMAQGLSYPLFTLLMQKQGMSAAEIGASAAMMPIGLMLSASLVPAAVRFLGARTLAICCLVGAAAMFFLIGSLQNWIAWYPARFLLGFLVNPLYVLGEVWALALAPPGKRGRVMGIFNAVMGVGYASGPLALATVGSQGWPPFLVAIGGFCTCAVVLTLVARNLSGFEAKEGEAVGGLLWFARLAPALVLAVLVAAAVQQSTYSLMPVFAAAHGLGEATIAALVSALSVGNIVLQVPLGLTAERVGARRMIVACALTTMCCAILLPLTIGTAAIWPVLVVMGGVGYGVYTMSVVELGDRFEGQTLVAGNAAFALAWGAGGVVGPPGAGLAMTTAGIYAYPTMLALLSGSLAAFVTYRTITTARRGGR